MIRDELRKKLELISALVKPVVRTPGRLPLHDHTNGLALAERVDDPESGDAFAIAAYILGAYPRRMVATFRASAKHGRNSGRYALEHTCNLDHEALYELELLLSSIQRLEQVDLGAESEPSQAEIDDLLHQLPNYAAALLYVYQMLGAWDPHHLIRKWTTEFQTAPSTLPTWNGPPRAQLNALEFRLRVGPIAEALGLHPERAAAANIAALLDKPAHVKETVEQILRIHQKRELPSSNPLYQPISSVIEAAIESVRKCILETPTDQLTSDSVAQTIPVTWKWHHAAGVAHRFHSKPLASFPGNQVSSTPCGHDLSALGAVVVLVPTTTSGTNVLGKLLDKPAILKYSPYTLKSSIGDAKPSGYRGLHLDLELVPTEGVAEEVKRQHTFRVQVVVADSESHQDVFATRKSAAGFLIRYDSSSKYRSPSPRNPKTISIVTPKGVTKTLHAGATILDFALSIHSTYPPLVRKAFVNGLLKEDVFESLADGDRVDLVLERESVILPSKPLSLLRYPAPIKRSYQIAIEAAPEMERKGWDYLWRTLAGDKLPKEVPLAAHVIATQYFSAACQRANQHFFLRQELRFQPRGRSWWLGQLALLELSESDPLVFRNLGIQCRVNTEIAKWLAETTFRELAGSSHGGLPNSQSKVPWRPCALCQPIDWEELSISTSDQEITYHRSGATCAAQATPVRQIIAHNAPMHFLIHAKDQTGLLANIVQVFANERIPITQIQSESLPDETAVVRIRTAFLPTTFLEPLISRLASNAQLLERRLLHYDKTHKLEEHLPPRQSPTEILRVRQASPYNVGSQAILQEDFYGRTNELESLFVAFDSVDNTKQGRVVTITGPHKVGKSSLARHFAVRAERTPKTKTAYLGLVDSWQWGDVVKKLSDKFSFESVVDSACQVDQQWQSVLETHAAQGYKLVITLDEVFPYLLAGRNLSTKRSDFVRFLTLCQSYPVILVLIGPRDAHDLLPGYIAHALRQGATDLLLSGFELSETMLYLTAQRKLSAPVQVPEGVASKAYAVTGGNPYWLSLLGDLMWQKGRTTSRNQSRSYVAYDEATLLLAIDQVSKQWRYFRDRFALHLEKFSAYESAIVTLLKSAIDNGRTYVTKEELSIATFAVKKATPKLFERYLNSVINYGGLVRSEKEGGKFELSAQILEFAIKTKALEYQ